MRKLLSFYSQGNVSLALLLIRFVVGFSIMMHGYPKLIGGVARWKGIGSAMNNLGIEFAPVIFGFLAMFSEFFGGLALMLGLFTRIASSGLAFTMMVAMVSHISRGDPFGKVSHPMELLVVFIGIILTGAGKYSVDSLISRKM